MKINNFNICLVLDRTGSVESERLPLEQGIEVLRESVIRKFSSDYSFDISVFVVGEGELSLPTETGKNTTLTREEEVFCSEIEAIKAAKEKLAEQTGKNIVILFSDGYFVGDDWRDEISELKSVEGCSTEIKTVALGSGYYKEALELLASNGQVYECEDIYDLI